MTYNRTQNTEPVLAVEGLTVRLAGEERVSGLSFSVSAGERVCLLGASGSGKSLTAKPSPAHCLRARYTAAAFG